MGKFKKGHIPFGRSLKGHETTQETKEKIGKARKKYISRNPDWASSVFKNRDTSGQKNPNWKGGKTEESKKVYNTKEYKKWRELVFNRCSDKCVDCGSLINLEAHHIISRQFKEVMLNPVNGVVLCKVCHRKTDNYAGRMKENYEITDDKFFIIMKTIPHHWQYYPTCGNYFFTGKGDIIIFVSEMADIRFNFLVLMHEAVEAFLIKEKGISIKEIDDFDILYEKTKQDDSEPGDDPNAPYFEEHQCATEVEKLLAKKLGVKWEEYDKHVKSL